ncbi:MAG: hypothetical protein E7467_06115 [Ruminococcaceae bacterium]|nr:hypothetical protein [Oscillospiraceae bacterium]
MMREILFRGKRNNGEWVEGSLVVWPDGATDICYSENDSFVEMTKTIVNPASVGQYTGLTDKNGNKIFEGDIVDILTEDEEIGIVAYDDGGFQVEADGFCVDFHSNINGTDLEVIGNIHDNPELIGGGE